jgi:uncharacterized membrane protein YqaE (UPF0057 family)
MNEQRFGVILAAGGALLILVAVLADPLGVGGQEGTFGWKQWVGVVLGVVSVAAGVGLATGRLKRRT